jgi:hypothetical protein
MSRGLGPFGDFFLDPLEYYFHELDGVSPCFEAIQMMVLVLITLKIRGPTV